MKRKIYAVSGTAALILGAASGGYALVRILILGSRLPAGVCPVTANRTFLYAGVALCVLSLIF